MASSDHKFYIGIAASFVIPTLVFAYTQGVTAQSITALNASIDRFQKTIDDADSRIDTIASNVATNNLSISNIGKKLDQNDVAIERINQRINHLEVNRGK